MALEVALDNSICQMAVNPASDEESSKELYNQINSRINVHTFSTVFLYLKKKNKNTFLHIAFWSM